MKRILIAFLAFFILNCSLSAQDNGALRTFKDTRVINTHAVDVLQKRKLDIRIGHRFGDLVGENGGWQTFYGLENSTDVLIGAEYGVTDKLTVGLYRAKGAGDLKSLVNFLAKYKILNQKENSTPISMTGLGIATLSTMLRNPDSNGLNRFDKFSHRFVYTAQLMIARRFSERFSFQIIPSYTHRNIVKFEETNGLISLGFASRVQLTKVMGFITDFTLPLNGAQSPFNNITEDTYYPVLGVGLEWDTGGHVFQLNFTNAKGIMETDYIPNTTSNWLDGEFRIGFTISRLFNL